MKKSDQAFQLYKNSISSKDYLDAINQNEQSHIEFLENLKQNELTVFEINELIRLVPDQKVKTLLLVYLLSSSVYLNNLLGDSLLSHLKNLRQHTPSRLNTLIQQLDLTILTPNLINQFQAEAAVSLLYSVPHYHQFTENQVHALIGRYPNPDLISYWLHHFVTMPNAHYLLVHFLKLADTHVWDEFSKKMTEEQKEAICSKMIEHLPLFNPNHKMLYGANDEEHLILAIQLFLNGHTDKVYSTYIHNLASKLIEKNHQFTLSAITQLLALNGKAEFKELNAKTAYLTNYNLRKNAQAGDISIFYDRGILNTLSMTQLVQSNLTKTSTDAPIHQTNKPASKKQQAPAEPIAENALLKKIESPEKTLTAFEYFLMHYQGDPKLLNKAIHDYLSFYAQENRSSTLYFASFLITRPEINSLVRETLFTAFLSYPKIFDNQITANLFQYDAARCTKHFGMQGGTENYKLVLQLCSWALSKLDFLLHKEQRDIATKAKWEAEQELSFSPNSNWFITIYNTLKRCWIYGWNGFFEPKNPNYVFPAGGTILMPPDNNFSTSFTKILNANPQHVAKNLAILVKEIKSPYNTAHLDEISESLQLFNLQSHPDKEIELRRAVHNLYHQIIYEKTANFILADWLRANQSLFTNNRIRLIEILLEKNRNTDDELLFSVIDDEAATTNLIRREFQCAAPQLKKIESPPAPIPQAQTPPPVVEAQSEKKEEIPATAFTKDEEVVQESNKERQFTPKTEVRDPSPLPFMQEDTSTFDSQTIPIVDLNLVSESTLTTPQEGTAEDDLEKRVEKTIEEFEQAIGSSLTTAKDYAAQLASSTWNKLSTVGAYIPDTQAANEQASKIASNAWSTINKAKTFFNPKSLECIIPVNSKDLNDNNLELN